MAYRQPVQGRDYGFIIRCQDFYIADLPCQSLHLALDNATTFDIDVSTPMSSFAGKSGYWTGGQRSSSRAREVPFLGHSASTFAPSQQDSAPWQLSDVEFSYTWSPLVGGPGQAPDLCWIQPGAGRHFWSVLCLWQDNARGYWAVVRHTVPRLRSRVRPIRPVFKEINLQSVRSRGLRGELSWDGHGEHREPCVRRGPSDLFQSGQQRGDASHRFRVSGAMLRQCFLGRE